MKKILGIIALFIVVTGCAGAQEDTNITIDQAKTIALESVENASFQSLHTQDDNFVITVLVDGSEKEVIVDQLGNLVSINVINEVVEETPTINENTGVSVGGAVNRDQAIDIAVNHLREIGINNANFAYAYSDNNDGVQVWSIEFTYNGNDLEFYVRKDNGELVKAPRG